MYTVRWDFALGMEILSLFANCRYTFPQSLLAKLTVLYMLATSLVENNISILLGVLPLAEWPLCNMCLSVAC